MERNELNEQPEINTNVEGVNSSEIKSVLSIEQLAGLESKEILTEKEVATLRDLTSKMAKGVAVNDEKYKIAA